MAKKEKRKQMVNGVRVYYKWNVGHIICFILLLVTIAIPILFWFNIPGFVPFGVNPGITVKEMILVLFGKIKIDDASFGLFEFHKFLMSLGGVSPDPFLKFALNALWYIILAMPLTTAIIAIIALFFFLFGLGGRWKHPSGPRTLAWWQFILTTLAVLGPAILCNVINSKAAEGAGKFNCMYLYIFAGATCASAILSTVFYDVFEKDKMYYKDALELPPLTPTQPVAVNGGFQGYNGPQVQVIPYPFPMMQPQAQPQQPAPVAQEAPVEEERVETKSVAITHTLPEKLSSIGGHAFSQNQQLEIATIPNGIKEIGPSAFSNCPNLKIVSIPLTVKKIGYNAFFNCQKLARINYAGKKEEWKNIVRGSNWLTKAGTTTVVCSDGAIKVNPFH